MEWLVVLRFRDNLFRWQIKHLINANVDFLQTSGDALNRAKKTLEELEERKFPTREPLWKVRCLMSV